MQPQEKQNVKIPWLKIAVLAAFFCFTSLLAEHLWVSFGGGTGTRLIVKAVIQLIVWTIGGIWLVLWIKRNP